MVERPGIVVYFDVMGPMEKLDNSAKGELIWAMLNYGKNGVEPEFDSLPLVLAWEFVKPKIDKDYREYVRSVQRRQFATTCRERKKRGEPDITFDEWLRSMVINDHQNTSMVINDHQWYPTTTTSATTSTTTSTSTTTAATECGGGTDSVVFLSDEQVSDLRSKMGEAAFRHYVDKLAGFIVDNGARVKNHYETILKWWREDGKPKKHARNRMVSKGSTGQLGAEELDNIRRLLEEG